MAHVLVTGGVRSGKSRFAESWFSSSDPVRYLTPGYPEDAIDAEWAARVQSHKARRPAGWETIETLELANAIRDTSRPVLIDCLGTWVTRLFDTWDAWEAPAERWRSRMAEATEELADAIKNHPADVVVVTNEVGWGVVSEYRSGRIFADQLGWVNQRIAAECDQVVLAVAGRALLLPDAYSGRTVPPKPSRAD